MKKILLFTVIFFYSLPIFAGEITLKEIYISKGEGYSQIKLIFDKDFKASPSFLIDDGVLQIILPQSKFNKELAQKRVNDGFLDRLRMKTEGKNSILEVQFSEGSFRAEGLVRDRATFEAYDLMIYHDSAALPADPNVEAKKAAQAPPPEMGSAAVDVSPEGMIKVLVALAVILFLIYLFLTLYNKYFVKNLSQTKGKYRLKVSSNYHLSPKQKISIVEVNDMAFAVGVTPNQISVISKVSDDAFINYLSNINLKRTENVDFGALREEYLTQAVEQVKPEPKESFTHEFIQKVKSMKPID
ncbi:MAG: flagellar biosynthetic protein FliO [SAR324 cluster bacterium]|nr:flagellar biosynthetic protein FliO [SAR324 cluster bacterium]